MPLSATFTANFASFYDAVDKADAKLKDFGEGADKVGGRLSTLANQFSGRKIVQEATVMAKAVEEIGGVSKLTEQEMARLGATTNEAVTKMKLLGMDVPKNLQEIADATKNANKNTADWMGTLTKIGGILGVAFSIDAVKNFIGGILDSVSAIKDLSQQWGISTTAVQQFTGAARQSGIEAETVGKSIQFLTEQLGEGSEAYRALLANVGLSYDKLRHMPLEDAYKEVVKAIAGIKDETLQLDVAQGLLGVSSKKMVGAIRDGFLEAADAQKVYSDETIKRLDAAMKKWRELKDNVVINSAEMLTSMQKTTEHMTSSWGNFFTALKNGLADPFGGGTAMAMVLGKNEAALADYGKKAKDAGQDIALFTEKQAAAVPPVKSTAEVLDELRRKHEAEQKAEQDRKDGLAKLKKEEEEYTKVVIAHQNAINDLLDEFSGAGLISKANLYLEVLRDSIPIEQMTEKEKERINQVMEDAIEVYAAMGTEGPDALYAIWEATNKVVEGTEAAAVQLKDLGDLWPTIGDQMKSNPFDLSWGKAVKLAPLPPTVGEQIAGELSSSILRAIEGGGSILQAAGSTIGNFLLDPKKSGVGKAIEAGAQKLPGLMGSAISSAIPVVGSLIGPAIGWLSNKISGWFGKKEYEKLRDGFIQSAGGISELTKAAQTAGISLDNLLRARKTDQVQNAIKTIQDALESEKLRAAFVSAEGGFEALQAAAEKAGVNIDELFSARTADQVNDSIKKIEDALKFQQDAYQLAIDTAQKYGFTLEELGPAMQRQELDKQAQQLFKDWEVLNAAGIDTVAITQRMSESVNDYVHHAMKMGTEVPDAMRPMLEAMVKSGTLLDENGNAISNLEDAGISFSLSMSDGFKQLIDEVHNLTDAISRSLGLAIKEIPQPKVKGTVTWDVEQIAKPTSSAGNVPLESYQSGTGGFKNFGEGTPVMLHGWEAVVPREESGAFATVTGGGAAGSAVAPTIIVNAQGAFFDTPDSLQRLAAKVSDALTAKYSVMGRLRTAV